jgi:hypothetical protein
MSNFLSLEIKFQKIISNYHHDIIRFDELSDYFTPNELKDLVFNSHNNKYEIQMDNKSNLCIIINTSSQQTKKDEKAIKPILLRRPRSLRMDSERANRELCHNFRELKNFYQKMISMLERHQFLTKHQLQQWVLHDHFYEKHIVSPDELNHSIESNLKSPRMKCIDYIKKQYQTLDSLGNLHNLTTVDIFAGVDSKLGKIYNFNLQDFIRASKLLRELYLKHIIIHEGMNPILNANESVNWYKIQTCFEKGLISNLYK